ncbi:MAG: GNAT family N-acetyltransferase [Microbacterium sp.]
MSRRSSPRDSDVQAIFAACQDPDIQRYTTIPSPYTHAHAVDFIAKTAAWWQEGSETTWAIRIDGTLAGMVGLHRLDDSGAGEIGYWMAPAQRGRGLLTEASQAVIDWGFSAEGLSLTRIEWRAVAGNVASARVARALGFRYEGLLHEGLVGKEGRVDGWIAGLLSADNRAPQPWPVLDA